MAIRSVYNALSHGSGLVAAALLCVEILCSILKHQFFNVVAGLLDGWPRTVDTAATAAIVCLSNFFV